MSLKPLILDFVEPIDVVYDTVGRQASFAATTIGTPSEVDSGGPDPLDPTF